MPAPRDVPRSDAVLTARGLRLTRAGVPILRGVDLTVHRGEVVALLGPNGAGKSTLLAVLSGLAEPDSGHVHVEGRVGVALQSPALAGRTARANVELGLRWWGVPRSERRSRAEAALASVGASGLADRPARSLSGGEARRIHLARALAVRPDLLLLDEPFAGLDAATRADLLGDAAHALRDAGRATMVVVHDRAEAWALADRVVVLLAGATAADGPVDHVLRRPPSEEVADFLGFDGRIVDGDGVLRLRTSDVVPADSPPAAATAVGQPRAVTGVVTRRVPLEDGVRLTVDLPTGRVSTVAPAPGPGLGDTVTLWLLGGVRYPLGPVATVMLAAASAPVTEPRPPGGPTP